VVTPSLLHRKSPSGQSIGALRCGAQRGAGTEDQQGSKICVTPFSDGPQGEILINGEPSNVFQLRYFQPPIPGGVAVLYPVDEMLDKYAV
jgi:hypothetical protein